MIVGEVVVGWRWEVDIMTMLGMTHKRYALRCA